MHRFFAPVAVLFVLLAGSAAHAHRVLLSVTAAEKSPHVLVEAFFDDGTAAKNAKVTVQDESKNEIAAGATDDEGKWTFTRPGRGLYVVLVNAGAGHRTRESIFLEDDAALTAPSREEQSRFPWWNVSAGLGVMAALGGVYMWRRRVASMSSREDIAPDFDA